jgi:RNA polymerase sigma-70 factor (ECF subfamily)
MSRFGANRFGPSGLLLCVTVTVLAPTAATLGAVTTREQEFRAFYAAEYAAVAGYCWNLLRDRDLAHDVTQEAFTRLLARWVRVDDPRAYVFSVATNLVRRAWRSRADTVAMLARLRSRPEQVSAPPDPDALGVRAAVEALPKRLRDVVLLHYFADLSVTEVARSVGRPDGTVKRQLSEARGLLAGVLVVPDV